MEQQYADAKFKQLAIEYTLTLVKDLKYNAVDLVKEAKIIEAYLKEDK